MLEPGKFYLFACPWDWTFIGEYVRHFDGGRRILIRNGGYFTRTGATFNVLCSEGFKPETKFHATVNGLEQGISAEANWWQWTAKTPWVKK